MKVFLFSKRFLIPLCIFWILHLAYVEWEMWRLYEPDLAGKGFSSSFKMKWLLTQATGNVMPLAFLISFLIAMVFYSHYRVKKDKYIAANFFSKWSLLAVIFLAIVAFLYTSYIEPKSNFRSQVLLARIIWSKSVSEFKGISAEGFSKSPAMMTIAELFHASDSLKTTDDIKEDHDSRYLNNNQRKLYKIRYEINKKISLPFLVILFYFLGMFLGASCYKIHVIVPFLIGYLIIFISWYYLQRIFERLYHGVNVGAFIGSNAATIFFSLLAVAWFFVLRKYGLFTMKNNGPESPGSINFDNSGIE